MLINQTITDLHVEILDKCANFDFVSIPAEEIEAATPATREKCATQVQVSCSFIFHSVRKETII